jgi:hypothetical protein
MRRISAILVALVLSLSACGGDEPEAGTVNTDVPEQGSVGAIDAVRCSEVAAAMAAAAAAAPQALAGGSGSDLGQSTQTLEAFAGEAPEEIREDLAVIADGYAAVAQALEGADFDPASGQPPPPEVIAQLEAASQELNTPEFQEATTRVSTWFATECGAPGA